MDTKTSVDIEEIKIEEDSRAAKELEFYSRKNEGIEKANIEESPKKEPISPVLKRNPFIKQKLSKFQCTYSDSEAVVKSRYFSRDSNNLVEGTIEQDNTRRELKFDEIETKTGDYGAYEISKKQEVTVKVEKKTTGDDITKTETEKMYISCDIEIQESQKVSINVGFRRSTTMTYILGY